jgi:hypothetical protein
MLSLATARERYEKHVEPDYLVVQEHERCINSLILHAIENEEPCAFYEVPLHLWGPWPTYNVDEMTIELLARARDLGYMARIVSLNPPTIRLSGWAGANTTNRGIRKQRTSARVPPRSSYVTATKRPVARRTPARVDPVPRGALSRRLHDNLQRFK